MDAVENAVAALQAGNLVVLPTDTVYGLCASAHNAVAASRINEMKKRPELAIAIIAASTDALIECVPEFRLGWQTLLEEVLPGPYTLVLPNPKRRLRTLSPGREETIGVRVPELPELSRQVLEQFGVVAASSANLHGEPDPKTVEQIPEEILNAVGAVIDVGELPGAPSTVIDLSGLVPRVTRQGAGDPQRVFDALG
jgi:tRNA threonylcarbamoyl adenosine modification protein (Sua5/YciO/YrdC/YwlC family)